MAEGRGSEGRNGQIMRFTVGIDFFARLCSANSRRLLCPSRALTGNQVFKGRHSSSRTLTRLKHWHPLIIDDVHTQYAHSYNCRSPASADASAYQPHASSRRRYSHSSDHYGSSAVLFMHGQWLLHQMVTSIADGVDCSHWELLPAAARRSISDPCSASLTSAQRSPLLFVGLRRPPLTPSSTLHSPVSLRDSAPLQAIDWRQDCIFPCIIVSLRSDCGCETAGQQDSGRENSTSELPPTQALSTSQATRHFPLSVGRTSPTRVLAMSSECQLTSCR